MSLVICDESDSFVGEQLETKHFYANIAARTFCLRTQ